MTCLNVYPIRTRIFEAKQDLADFVLESVPRHSVSEGMIVAVTSKIVSLAENRLVNRSATDKAALVKKEADVFLGEIGHGCFLTVKEGLFIPSSGIDESNSAQGDFILYPVDPYASARDLWLKLKTVWNLERLGILLTDSHTSPLRRGVTGICLAYWGFRGLRSMVGTKDLFGRELKMTNMNLADGLAASAVLLMGEGQERQPLALLSGLQVDFCDEVDRAEIKIPLSEDLYAPFFRGFETFDK